MNDKQQEQLKKHVLGAFNALKKIPVADAAVDYMAVARQELNNAWALLHQPEEVKTDG